MPHTVLAPTMGILWRTLKATGHDPAHLFRQMSVDPELIKDSHARIREETVIDLWQRAIELTGDNCLAIKTAKHWHPSQLGAMGYAWLASSTLRTALNRIARYIRVINDNRKVVLEEAEEGFIYRLQLQDGIDIAMPAIYFNLHLAVLIELCRTNYGEQLDPLAVTLTHSEPNCVEAYSAHFRCPVTFDADENSLTLPIEAIDRPLLGNNPMLATLSDQVMIEQLASLDRAKLTEQVKAVIIEQLPSGKIHINKVAGVLAISPRTLQRRLKSEGTSFALLLEEARRELAIEYVRKKSPFTLCEIAFLLGFSEESAFSRAFKRWTGLSPSRYVVEQSFPVQ